MIMLFYTLSKVSSETIKINKHHLLRIKKLHIAILWSLELVFSLYIRGKNKLEMLVRSCTNIRQNLILTKIVTSNVQ